MNSLNLSPIKTRNALVEVLQDEARVTVKFSGMMDELHPGEFLDPLFDQLHALALEKRIPALALDFTELNFLNSSGIKSVAKWIVKQMGLDETMRYPIKLLYANQLTWQRASIRALATMSKGSVEAEAVETLV